VSWRIDFARMARVWSIQVLVARFHLVLPTRHGSRNAANGVVLMRDQHIRRRLLEREALRSAGVGLSEGTYGIVETMRSPAYVHHRQHPTSASRHRDHHVRKPTILRVERMIAENRQILLERWGEYFSG